MDSKKYIYWKDDNMWVGYLLKYPDYWTEGETMAELKENLKDIFMEVTSANIPNVRKIGELEIA
ncbi:MAG: type II toxin-antitoxin system HicB family antitoxin [Chlorobi bacterium]|nr:type II toxin-antitoxin system HicB family antitoxin [Chlorobiota bacterium]